MIIYIIQVHKIGIQIQVTTVKFLMDWLIGL
jgi:hypothetical protein